MNSMRYFWLRLWEIIGGRVSMEDDIDMTYYRLSRYK